MKATNWNTRRFALDTMLGRTARWLRLFGCDVFYQATIGDDELLFRSLLQGRILLTRDTELAHRAGAAAYLVRANNTWEQLHEIKNHFGIEPVLHLRRCPVCNGEIAEVPKESVQDDVPQYTFLTHQKFWRCRKCGKVFWRGSHIEMAQQDILSKIG